MNIYATPIRQYEMNGVTITNDELGTEAHYIERGTYQSVRNFIRYRDPLKWWPTKVFAIYMFGDFQGEHTLVGYIYNFTEEAYAMAQAHLVGVRESGGRERIGHGYW